MTGEKGFTHRLIEMEGDLESLKESLARIEPKLDSTNNPQSITDRAKEGSIAGWIGAAATTLAVIGALAMTVIAPIQNDVEHLIQLEEIRDTEAQGSRYELGKQTATIIELQRKIEDIEKSLSSDEVDLEELEATVRSISLELALLVQRITSNEVRFQGIYDQRISSVDKQLAKLTTQIEEMWELVKRAHSATPLE